jgi:hypothetical protein
MMPPWDMYGCKMGSPYSMTTGNKCVPKTSVDSGSNTNCPTGVKCSNITPLPPVYDCTTAKNSTCGGAINPTPLPPVYDNDVCIDGTMVRDVDSKGRPYCTKTVDGVVKTMPTLALPIKKVSSTDDMKAVQKALNSALKDKLSTPIGTDGKS